MTTGARPGMMRWTVLFGVALLGCALTFVTLAAEPRSVLGPMALVALSAEIALVIYVVVAARRAVAALPEGETDATTRFRLAARQVARSRGVGDVLTTEVMLLYYAFRRPPRQAETSGAFTVHRTTSYLPILVAIGMALIVETVAVHFLVRVWSAKLAWVLTALSAYTLLWLMGDYRALVSRPIRLSATHLRFRYGLRWEADIPRDAIVEAGLLPPALAPTPKEKTRLVASLPGGPNLRMWLERPVEVLGLYGWRKTITELRVRVDEPEKLRDALVSG